MKGSDMGCDIHTMAEVRLNRFKKGDTYYNKWFAVGKAFKVERAAKEPPMVWSPREEFQFEAYENNSIVTEEPYRSRNYNLFALLADVRNYSSGDNAIVPISQPKGVPKDASEYWKASVEHYGEDGHSHSDLTYKKLADNIEAALKVPGVRDDYLDLLHNLQGVFWRYPEVKDVRLVFFFDN
jgi:hypothetical protein